MVIVLLVACMLVGILSATLVGTTNSSSAMSSGIVGNIVSAQAGLIRSRILQCSIDYPLGNNATGFRATYPAAATIANVSTLTCPGSAISLWGQSDGVFMPTSLSGFNAWQYTNDATSMRLTLTSLSADRAAILPGVALSLGAQASVAGNSLTWVLSL